jgi:Ca2+-binding RTX toxin-like protein
VIAGAAGETVDEIVRIKVPSIADQIGNHGLGELPPTAKGGIIGTQGIRAGSFMADGQGFGGMDAGGWSSAGTVGIDGSVRIADAADNTPTSCSKAVGGTFAAGARADADTGTSEMPIAELLPPTPLAALDWRGTQVATTTVSVYFADTGEAYDGVTSDGWNTDRMAGVMQALQDIADVTGLSFVRTNTAADATFRMVSTYDADQDWSGYMNPPNKPNPGVGVFNTAQMDLDNLVPGSLDYFIIQHEVGHGLGMAHPHDRGGGSKIMKGVSSPFHDYGRFDLNQAVFTMMSYNVGYDAVFPSVSDFGATVGPMAFDIALLQQKYGGPAFAANNGNTIYDMPGANGIGTYFSCIWDEGGKDTIRYSGTADAIISLVAATLDYSPTGGGVVSYAAGIQGGFTIANGVVIENARGGRGNDDITGNAANNRLWGGGGRDTIFGGDGNDRLFGGNGADRLVGGNGNDRIFGDGGDDILIGGAGSDDFVMRGNFGRDTILDFDWADGNEDIDLRGVSSITSYDDLVNNHMTQVGMDVVIDALGGNILTILNTAICALGIDDFIF